MERLSLIITPRLPEVFFKNTNDHIIIADQYLLPYSRVYEESSDFDLFKVEIIPELTYFISSRFGLSQGLGGIEYSMLDWETDNSSRIINFNPVNWRFGIKVKYSHEIRQTKGHRTCQA